MFFDITLKHLIGDCRIALDLRSEARLTALVGPSGVGKTSVLNCIAGLSAPDHGQIAINGRTLFDSAAGINLPPEARRAGYVFQDMRLFPHLRVGGNLAFGERLAKGRAALLDRAEMEDLLDITRLSRRWPATLSGGEARRVAIGRALLSAPDFLLLDEPTASLDEDRARTLMSLIERIRNSLNIPILLVSHDGEEVARLAGRVVNLTETRKLSS